jgi:hypothetical protein
MVAPSRAPGYPAPVILRKAALRPVPLWARVDELALESLEATLGEDDDALQEALDDGFRALDRTQQALAAWLSEQVSEREDELAQSVGYFLAVSVFLAFREAFPTRLAPVSASDLLLALETLALDEELRANDPLEILDSDDVIALSQPALVAYVQHHLDEAMRQCPELPREDDFDAIYRAVLVEVVALSHAVLAPTGQRAPAFA